MSDRSINDQDEHAIWMEAVENGGLRVRLHTWHEMMQVGLMYPQVDESDPACENIPPEVIQAYNERLKLLNAQEISRWIRGEYVD